ncbi:MAG: sodium-dependent transporter [Oscillospiraceae bacterium]
MEERKGFGSNFGFLMAAVGSAVGLGNIWGFPNKMGACGGFTFLIIYLILAVCCGFIVMVGELAIGRKTGKGAVAAYKALSKKFSWMGWMGILSAFFILFFYCALGGYCIKYVVLNVGDLFGAGFGASAIAAASADAASASLGDAVFGAFMSSTTEAIIYGLIFVVLTMLIVLGGVGGGIEKVCSVGMPALFVALLICIIRACTLDGVDTTVQVLQTDGSLVEHVIHGSALDGLKYMFAPGWATENGYYVPASAVIDGVKMSAVEINGVMQRIVTFKQETPDVLTVLATAGGQMFFSLSLGMGAMITYGSYLQKKENIQKNALLIVVMDTMVALMAGLCVLPGRFALDPSGAVGGPSLLFVTMQNVFSRMGGLGPIFGILFYLLVVFAAISSSISLLEVIVAHFVDKARDEGKGDKRKSYTLIAAACVGLGCILVCADRLGASSFSPAELLNIANPKTWAADWLDFWDALSEGVMMPLGALLMSLMIGWEIGPEFVKEETEQSGHAMGSYGFFKVCVKFITPLIMVLILYGQIKEFFL